MNNYVNRLRSIVVRVTPLLLEISDSVAAQRSDPGKWSRQEILGHLIDSASNNHQRFVRAQSQDDLEFSGYDQDAWVLVQQYQTALWPELVTLWRAFNLHIARVMESVPESVRLQQRHRHNLDRIAWRPVPAGEPATLEYFMNDYVDHLEHHLKQILGSRIP